MSPPPGSASGGWHDWQIPLLPSYSPLVVEEKEEMLAKKEKKAKEWIEKEDKEQLTGNGRKGLELREGGKEMF